MNKIGIALAMFLIAGSICWFEIFTVKNDVDAYNLELEKVCQLMNEDDFNKASELSSSILSKWKQESKRLDKYLYHDYIDELTQTIATLPVYADNQDKVSVKAQVEDLGLAEVLEENGQKVVRFYAVYNRFGSCN